MFSLQLIGWFFARPSSRSFGVKTLYVPSAGILHWMEIGRELETFAASIKYNCNSRAVNLASPIDCFNSLFRTLILLSVLPWHQGEFAGLVIHLNPVFLASVKRGPSILLHQLSINPAADTNWLPGSLEIIAGHRLIDANFLNASITA